MAIDREHFERAHEIANNIVEQIELSVTGKHNEVVMLVVALLAGGHVLIEDVPGVGKTTLAASLAAAAGLDFKRAQFTPDVMASDITGFNVYNRTTESFEFKPGLVMCNILLADEINRASPKTQSSLLEAMEERRVTVDGTTYKIPDIFMVVATQNPSGFVGTYPLPEAQLDRFTIKLSMGYPTAAEELDIIRRRRTKDPAQQIRPAADENAVKALRSIVSMVECDDVICEYIVSLVSATRVHPMIALGASPRASLALMRISRAHAFMQGRDYVIPEDVAAVFVRATAHRLIMKQDSRPGRGTPESVLSDILRDTPSPIRGKRTK